MTEPVLRVSKIFWAKDKPRLHVPKAVMEDWGNPKYVLIRYDRKTKRLIIEPYKEEE